MMRLLKILLLSLLMIPCSAIAQAWDVDIGEANIDSMESYIVIESNVKGQFVIMPKMFLSTTIQLDKRKVIFAWGTEHPIREMKFSDPSDALRILHQIYPKKYYCLNNTGVKKCKMGNIFGVKE